MVPSPGELTYLVDHLSDALTGAALQKIRQPAPQRFLLEFFLASAGKTRLLVDLDPRGLRFHQSHVRFDPVADAPPFLLLLRKFLENARVRQITARPGDRIIDLEFDRVVDGVVRSRRLVIELIPAHPGLFVLDENNVVLAASTSVKSDQREVRRGARYASPKSAPLKEPEQLFARFGDWSQDQLNQLLDAELEEKGAPRGPDRSSLTKALSKAIKRQAKRCGKVEQDWRKSEGGEELLRLGELLKASLGEVRRGMETISVRDWEHEGEVFVEIPLDPKLDPKANIQALFNRAQKKIRGQETVLERLELQREHYRDLQDLEAELAEASAEDLPKMEAKFAQRGIVVEETRNTPAKKKAPPAPRVPYIVFTSKDGLEIRVGRGAKDNDELTFKHCRGNEWWLHAQDYPGSHVVVKTEGELPEQTLLDAATLAVVHSKAKKASRLSVSYTRRKNVQKAKGAPAGQVLLKSHRSILVRIEDERLMRLKSGGK